ncbi:MAG: MFS transporter [Spirochaetota bacterium]
MNGRIPESRHEHRDLALLITGNVVSTFGNAVYILAVLLLLKELTNSAFMLGLFQFLALAPAFFLSPLTGALIDRVPRRRIVILADLYRGVLMITAGAALTVPELRAPWFVLPITLLMGVGHALFVPAAHAILPSLVSDSRLQTATGLRAAGSQIANLGGNATGGALFALLGASALFLLNGVTFLVSAVQELFIRGGREVPRDGSERSDFGAAARDGLRTVLRDRAVLPLMASQAGLFVVSPVLLLSLPFIVIDELGMGERALGYFFALAIAGGIAAFGLLRRQASRLTTTRRRIAGAYVLLGAAFVAVAVGTSVLTLILAALAGGAAAATVYLSVTTYIQRRAPGHLLGRYFAALEAASALVAPVSYLAVGALLEGLDGGRWGLFAVVGGVTVAWGIILARPLKWCQDC